ncbi:MAG: gpW family protein [Castellaniella sp.]|nr:gpW family protein [Castellaniella sp.]
MSVYDGMSQSDLQARLVALQTAYGQLLQGTQVASASYMQSDGSRTVSYRATDLSRLLGEITLIQQKLGIVCRARRQISFVMR